PAPAPAAAAPGAGAAAVPPLPREAAAAPPAMSEPWMAARDRFLALPEAQKQPWYKRYEAERVGPQSALAASPDYGRLPEVRIWRDFAKARQANPAARPGTSALVYFSKWLARVWAQEGRL
ncbi:hypothetical protein, partial [Azohydromonas aeria]|uniref:hypothetical protein n=1 Tax=Azohydromonas aeria TaxID=2590212 RepID=UPI0018DF2CBD